MGCLRDTHGFFFVVVVHFTEYKTRVIYGTLCRDHREAFIYKHAVSINNLHRKVCYVSSSVHNTPKNKKFISTVFVTMKDTCIYLPNSEDSAHFSL